MSTQPPPRPGQARYEYHEAPGEYTRNVGGSGSNENEKIAGSYAGLALAHTALAMPLLFQPREAATFLLGGTALPTNVEQDRLMGLLAAGLLSGATTAWSLKGAAEERHLSTAASERLQLGLMALGAASLGVHFAHVRELTRNGFAVGAAAAVLTVAVPASHALGSKRARRRLGSHFKRLADGIGRLFDFQGRFKLSSVLYAGDGGGFAGLLTPAFFVAGASYLLAPQRTLGNLLGYVTKGNDSIFLWRQAGSLLLTLLPAVTYTLKEKAEDNRLAEQSSRTLNSGILLTSIGNLAVLGPMANEGSGGRYLPLLVGTWAAAFSASVIGLSTSNADRSL
ncbi:hypothetical protein D9Q98_007678 [Chlorella vulgaris]|uniref:Uncharacterized protein n=1 Tax=Chlorella vulgaris TaxID=3077 RepID=A0A9D4YTW2_CHLVU|nr:hypothetical protein D9Q98_007678 [Chlorella vulgaris]